MSDKTCIFCSLASGQVPTTLIAENEHVVAFADRTPRAPVHILIVPKKHIINLNDITKSEKEIVWAMVEVAQQLAREMTSDGGFNLIANNGLSAGQSVFHMHWHFLAGRNIYQGGFSL